MLDFDECWAALEKRDGAAAGRFFYGVLTTGVYCRPGCTSRLPLRRNTALFRDDGGVPRRLGCGHASVAARPSRPRRRGILRPSKRPARCCAVAKSCQASPNSPKRRRSAGFIFIACSNR